MPREASEKVGLKALPPREGVGGLMWKLILLQKTLGNSSQPYFFAFFRDATTLEAKFLFLFSAFIYLQLKPNLNKEQMCSFFLNSGIGARLPSSTYNHPLTQSLLPGPPEAVQDFRPSASHFASPSRG